jgi:chorismate mutase
MPSKAPTAPPTLADLRREIDRIDEDMHRLLMQRGDIIDRLIATKHTQESGSAFRPAREAEMMRRLVERHRGILPLDTVESIWRVIISTFTYVQAPYAVHADLTAGEAAVRDSARFHFGFTAPLIPHLGASGVVAAVRAKKSDMGMVPAVGVPGAGAWWTLLEADDAPRVIARLPFVERADHPAALPMFVLTYPAADAVVKDVELWSLNVAGWSAGAAHALDLLAEAIVVPDKALDGAALLVSLPRGRTIDEITAALVSAGVPVKTARPVGSHAACHRVGDPSR